MNNRRVSLNYALFILCMYIFVFQNLIQKYVPIFQYFDEAIAMLFFPILFFKGKNLFRIKKNGDNLGILIILIGALGLLSSITFQYQGLIAVLSDCLVFFKFFMLYYISSQLWSVNMIYKYKKGIIFNVKIIIITLAIMTVLAYTTGAFPAEYRYGILSNKLFYSHPTYLVAICVFLYAIYLIAARKVFDMYTCMLLCIILSTLRVKAYGAIIAIALVSMYVWTRKRKLDINKVLILGVFLVLLFSNKISYYFFTDRTDMARTQLLLNSFKVANDHFPLGSGFATFGSYYSGVYYSPLYSIYGMSNIWGLTADFYEFVADGFWPMLIAQFGYLGTCCYLLMLYKMFKNVQLIFDKNNLTIYVSKLICLLYLIISSIAENSFAGPIGMTLAIIIGLSVNNERKIR